MSDPTPEFELDTIVAHAAKARTMNALFGADEATPEKIGGYAILDVLGRGAMGVVYLAHDDRLDRAVALKLLDPGRRHDPKAKASLVKEAKQIARVQHPNVVAVYEVGDHGGDTFLAMEYVAGPTLREWSRAQGHTIRHIVRTYADAGRGLAAVHEAGLLHRDFKPSNVLVTASGLAKVADFGLARIVRDERTGALAGSDRDPSKPVHESSAAIAGTPAYMAPEQFVGAATAKSDQFAFGVALLEALSGAAPFGRASAFGLDAQEASRRLSELDRTRLPGWLFDALSRAVAWDPDARWPDMLALVAALEDDPRRRRWRAVAGVAGVAVLGSVGALWYAQMQSRGQRCSGAQAKVEASWGNDRRVAVRDAFLGTKASYASSAWSRTEAELDRYAAAWVQAYNEACEATTIRGEQSSEIMDLRMACMHRSNTTLAAVAKVLAEADADVVVRAHEVVDGLRPLSRCSDVESLLEDVEPPLPEEAEAVDSARRLLAQAAAQTNAGQLEEAEAGLQAAFGALSGVRYPSAHVEAKLHQATLFEALGRYKEAEATLRGVLQLASSERLWDALWRAQTDLIFVVGNRLGQHEEGLRYQETAAGLAGGDRNKQAQVDTHVALVLLAQGEYARAESRTRRALDAFVEVLGPEHRMVATACSNLAAVLSRQGKREEAEAQTRRGLAIRTKSLGAGHPATLQSRNNLGLSLMLGGHHSEAETEIRAVLEQWERMYGPSSPRVAEAHNNLGLVLQQRGALQEAEAEHRRALSIREEKLGVDHLSVAESSVNLADLLVERGAYKEAIERGRAARSIWEGALGPEHPNLAAARHTIGRALARVGDFEAAEAEHRRALAIWVDALGSDHVEVARSRADLAAVLLERGAVAEALALAEQAWSRQRSDDVLPEQRATGAFVLARALWESDPEPAQRARALEFARTALEAYRDGMAPTSPDADRVREWLLRRARVGVDGLQ